MNPFFFGDSRHQLFGVYESTPGRSARGAVVCYPWAREYLLAHPTMRLLSQRLSAGGWHTLRFDYFGTGDSAGGSTEGSQQQWLTDIDMAIEELKELGDVREVALIGMRVGATLASLAAARRRDISRLVLWDPVTDGKRFLAELGVAKANGKPITEIDVSGAVLTPRLRAEFEAITPESFGANVPRTLVVSTDASARTIEPFVTHLRSRDVDCAFEHLPSIQPWRQEWGRNENGNALAVEPVRRIVSWLS